MGESPTVGSSSPVGLVPTGSMGEPPTPTVGTTPETTVGGTSTPLDKASDRPSKITEIETYVVDDEICAEENAKD